jgi:hypothetical protein
LMSEKVLPASPSNGVMDREHAEIKYNEYLNNVGRQAFEALSASDQMRLLSAAQAEIKSGPYASKYQRMPSEKFAEHLRVMVETKLSRMHSLPFEEWYNRQRKDR